VPRKKTDIRAAIAAVPCALPERYLMIALQATACGNLDFLIDRILFDEDALWPGPRPDEVYAKLDRLVEQAPAGARGLLYTPWIFGERAPVEDRSIRAGLHNLSLEHARRDVVRAVYEGVALNTRWVLGPVERFLGHRAGPIAAVGGGARSAIWCQILADVLDRPVRRMRQPIEANVRGSAFLAWLALDRLTLADIPALTPAEALHEPNPAHRQVYERHFAEFKRLYTAHRPIHARLNAFHHRSA
jgi:xylulokinase